MKKLILLGAAFVVLIAGAYVLYTNLQPEETPGQLQVYDSETPKNDESNDTEAPAGSGVAAPDITVYDRTGKPVKLSDYFGKPIVLNFWASWCGPCQSEMPDFEKKYQEMGEDVQFLMVNMTDGQRETVDKAAGFIAGAGYTFPVFYDTDLDAAVKYEVSVLPATYFINAEGYLMARATGAINERLLQQGIDMIQ